MTRCPTPPALALSLCLFACAHEPDSVERVVDGRPTPGRYVRHSAYLAYTQGALLQAQGDLLAAISAYQEALQSDPQSVEIWTRIGALRCQLGQAPPQTAFAEAEEIEPLYEPIWRERGLCLWRKGHKKEALVQFKRALALDPDRGQTSLLIIGALHALGKTEEARRWLGALRLRHPDLVKDVTAQSALSAEPSGVRRRFELESFQSDPSLSPEQAALEKAKLDAALNDDDLARARQHATRGGISSAELALRAAALGKPALAEQQAQLILSIDPENLDGLVARLVAADLSRDQARFEQALFSLGERSATEPTDMSDLAVLLFAELLGRRSNPESALAFLRARGGADIESTDPLVKRLVARSAKK